jgi:hypothetical protein
MLSAQAPLRIDSTAPESPDLLADQFAVGYFGIEAGFGEVFIDRHRLGSENMPREEITLRWKLPYFDVA